MGCMEGQSRLAGGALCLLGGVRLGSDERVDAAAEGGGRGESGRHEGEVVGHAGRDATGGVGQVLVGLDGERGVGAAGMGGGDGRERGRVEGEKVRHAEEWEGKGDQGGEEEGGGGEKLVRVGEGRRGGRKGGRVRECGDGGELEDGDGTRTLVPLVLGVWFAGRWIVAMVIKILVRSFVVASVVPRLGSLVPSLPLRPLPYANPFVGDSNNGESAANVIRSDFDVCEKKKGSGREESVEEKRRDVPSSSPSGWPRTHPNLIRRHLERISIVRGLL